MLSSCKHFVGHIGIVHYMTVFIGINSLFSVFVYKHSVLAYINLSAVFVLYMYSVCKADVYLVAVFASTWIPFLKDTLSAFIYFVPSSPVGICVLSALSSDTVSCSASDLRNCSLLLLKVRQAILRKFRQAILGYQCREMPLPVPI